MTDTDLKEIRQAHQVVESLGKMRAIVLSIVDELEKGGVEQIPLRAYSRAADAYAVFEIVSLADLRSIRWWDAFKKRFYETTGQSAPEDVLFNAVVGAFLEMEINKDAAHGDPILQMHWSERFPCVRRLRTSEYEWTDPAYSAVWSLTFHPSGWGLSHPQFAMLQVFPDTDIRQFSLPFLWKVVRYIDTKEREVRGVYPWKNHSLV